jgi:hypothetical protein
MGERRSEIYASHMLQIGRGQEAVMRYVIAVFVAFGLAAGGVALAECGDGEEHPAVIENGEAATVPVSYEPSAATVETVEHHDTVQAPAKRTDATDAIEAGPREPRRPTKADPDLGVESYPAEEGSILNGRTRID